MNKIGNIIFTEKMPHSSVELISAFSASLDKDKQYVALLGFCDVHVHFREPGFSYKGTIYEGSRSAARGGYTAVCTMPNLNPVPDSVANISEQIAIIERDAIIDVYPYAAITVGEMGKELSDMQNLAPLAIAFSDDGRGVQSEALMEEAMIKARDLGKMIVAHCEDNSLLHGGYIHDGEYARTHGHRGICSESEWGPIKRDIELVRKIGCAYHVCHISTKESVELIRRAKREGVNITCETAPHYLILNDNDLEENGRFKMNPPIRSEEDRLALIDGIKDGTIDMIATDHAPHSAEEKSRGLEKSAFGVVGLETAFPALYKYLVKPGIITLERLEELLSIRPRERFSIPHGEGDFSIWEIGGEYTVNPGDFISAAKATPLENMLVEGRCVLTVKGGKQIYKDY